MNLQQQEKFVDEFLGKMRATMLSKGNDYANADRLSNFKLAGAICGLTPEQNCLSMIATKVARLGVLLAGKTPNNESIEDSLLDLANYGVLLACLREEKLDKPFLVNFNPETGKMTASEWVPDGYQSGVPPSLEEKLDRDFGVQDSNTFSTVKIHEGDDYVVKDESGQSNGNVTLKKKFTIHDKMKTWSDAGFPTKEYGGKEWIDELVAIGNEDRSESFEKDLNIP